MTAILGIDLGGTKIAAGLVDESGAVSGRRSVATPARDGAAAVLAAIVELAREVIGSVPDTPVGCGIGAAGVIDPVTGDVLSATGSLPGWSGTALRTELSALLDLPVLAMNDVQAHSLGEAVRGAGAGHSSVLTVAAGTGIGGALVVDGSLLRGRHGAAGHYGHIVSADAVGRPCPCGGTGHVESVASGPALRNLYLESGGDAADAREVFALAATGDQRAQAAIDRAATALGVLIGGLVNEIDPDLVVLAGGLADSGDSWTSCVTAAARREMLPLLRGCPIVPARLGSDSALVGAALAFERARPLPKGTPQ
jgi:glucokinase